MASVVAPRAVVPSPVEEEIMEDMPGLEAVVEDAGRKRGKRPRK